MKRFAIIVGFAGLRLATWCAAQAQEPGTRLYTAPIDVEVPSIASDAGVKYDYDLVYVRVPRQGDDVHPLFAEVFHPTAMDAGGDLMLLHPDGSEDLLVSGGDGSVLDPYVSFDGQWVYYAKLENLATPRPGRRSGSSADIYKIHVPTRKIVRLTDQQFTPNTGAADWSKDYRTREAGKTALDYGVFNLGPCPLPGGRVMFVSNRNAFRPNKGYTWPCLQLFTMDDDGGNVEMIGYINLGSALHPTILRDGRVLFSSYEAQGLRDQRVWGLWSIHPDGTNWAPVVSALFEHPNVIHFQTQLSDGSLVVEDYYNLNNSGFGPLYKLPERAPTGTPAFGPAYNRDPRNPPLRAGRFSNGKPAATRLGFSPVGIEALTPFVNSNDNPAGLSVIDDPASPRVGKFTHPSGAPENHLLVCYSPGPANHHYGRRPESFPAIDSGIYLIKDGTPIDEPAQMLRIKNDPRYNEQWPRALVPYQRIYGVAEPAQLPPLANDGRLSSHLPEGTPFGLVGTSSLYKRESFPNGVVPPGSVTSTWASPGSGRDTGYEGWDPFNADNETRSWTHQGAEAGRYDNSDIHAIRILALEGTTDHGGPNRQFFNHAHERLRILGEIPVRKFSGVEPSGTGVSPAEHLREASATDTSGQPADPDGNPDTSFLAKIPADVAFTFQTLDRNGMALNMAQTWHQVRPGEIRTDCGGCHAHSQQPTDFGRTLAARPDYDIFDLTKHTPLVTSKAHDQSGRKWDAEGQSGLRYEAGVKNVEYFRDVRPILQRSCAACHTEQEGRQPAGNLVLDDDPPQTVPNGPSVPGTYFRLAADERAQFGHKPLVGRWTATNASRYVRKFQSRRSLLVWKVYGQRLDGWNNDDHPTERTPGDAATLEHQGRPLADTLANRRLADLDYTGSSMPPPEAVAGTYTGLDGKRIQVAPLSDEDRRTLARWIDLGCPIDLQYDPDNPDERGYGWMGDDQRPTLTMTYPRAGANAEVSRILIGTHDYYTGLNAAGWEVIADFPVNGEPAEENLAPLFTQKSPGVWELLLEKPLAAPFEGRLSVSVKDQQGNLTRLDRTFSVGPSETRTGPVAAGRSPMDGLSQFPISNSGATK
jgi:hypothetical protein